jgi:hypothetical protein
MRSWLPAPALLSLVALAATGCTAIPDVKPFSDATAALTTAAGTQYHDVANDVASIEPTQLPGESPGAFAQREKSVNSDKAIFAATSEKLDALFNAMTQYSEKLTSLVAAGKTGPQAVQSLLDSARGFAQVANVALPVAGAGATAVTNALKKIADQFTQMQAAKSLKEAVTAAQPAVNLVASDFQAIFGTPLDEASDYVRNAQIETASLAAGPSVVGFHDNVKRNYNDYYRFLNRYVAPLGGADPGAAWNGFCQPGHEPCRARIELEAVGLVEARMSAIQPLISTYEAQVAGINATLARRHAANAAVVRAVNAWALEHSKLAQSLGDGTPLSALNLRAAVSELNGLATRK